jgi:dTDP-4-amino-4,6-dideoxygalactose transaminase
VSLYSFHATKAYNSIEGGAAAYGDSELSTGFKRFINFGLVDGENVENTGTNAKMNEFSAAMGLCNLRHIGEVLEGRKRVCNIYKKILFECDPLFDEKTGIAPSFGIKMLPVQDNVESNYAYFPVLFGVNENCKVTRDQVKDMLASENIHARRYFYPLTSEFDCYRGMKGAGETPVAESISRKVLSLPLYAELSSEDAVMIAEMIKAFLK